MNKSKLKIHWFNKNGTAKVTEFLSPSTRISDSIRMFEMTEGKNLKRISRVEAAELNDIVKVTSYGKTDTKDRMAMISFYEECANGSEGAERERYQYVLDQLRMGKSEVNSDTGHY